MLKKYTNIEGDKNRIEVSRPSSGKKKGIGLILVAVSAISFSVMSMLIKLANRKGEGLSALSLSMYRGVLSFIFNFMYSTLYLKIPNKFSVIGIGLGLSKVQIIALVGRSIAGTLSLTCGFFAFTLLPLGDASSLIFTSPILTFILARIFLKEAIGIFELVCGLISLIGVCLISKPKFLFGTDFPLLNATMNTTFNEKGGIDEKQHLLGVVAALSAALASAGAYVFVRKLGDVKAETVVGSFMFTAFWVNAILSLLTNTFTFPSTVTQVAYIIGIGFCGFFGQIMMTRGFALVEAGVASVMRNVDIVMAYVWSVIILHENISVFSIIGAFIIMSSAIAVTLNKIKNSGASDVVDVIAEEEVGDIKLQSLSFNSDNDY
jgi:drug/metabolite transporter (DMT)-like permease